MVLDLHQVSPPPGDGMMTVCEDEAVLLSNNADDAERMAQDLMGCGEPILLCESNELVRPALGKQDAQLAFTAKPRLPASIAMSYHEQGLLGCLEQVVEQCRGKGVWAAVGLVAAALLKVAGVAELLLRSNRLPLLERSSSTRSRNLSGGSPSIICISWHGSSQRLAVGYTDDSVRILSQKPLQPLLKHRTQRNISQVHWLPYSMHVVCVSCEAGVLLWSVDPSSVVTRPSGACITLLPSPCMGPGLTTIMTPHPKGLTVSSSGGRGVSVWDVALTTSSEIQQAGPVTHLLYSPDATRLVVVMGRPTAIRMFDTSDWSLEEFVCNNPVTSCVWSPCSQYVVFSCSSPPRRDAGDASSLGSSARGGSSVLYGISVDGSTREATVLVDLTPVQIMDQGGSLVSIGGVVQSLVWQGERLVVLFAGCPYLVLYHTNGLSLSRGGAIKGPDDCVPVTAAFRQCRPSLLTVVWSDNLLQHIPLLYNRGFRPADPSSHSWQLIG